MWIKWRRRWSKISMCSKFCLFLVHSDVIFANTNQLYTEPVTGHARKNDVQHYKDLVKKDQDSLYDTVVDGVESNPAYDRSNYLIIHKRLWLSCCCLYLPVSTYNYNFFRNLLRKFWSHMLTFICSSVCSLKFLFNLKFKFKFWNN